VFWYTDRTPAFSDKGDAEDNEEKKEKENGGTRGVPDVLNGDRSFGNAGKYPVHFSRESFCR